MNLELRGLKGLRSLLSETATTPTMVASLETLAIDLLVPGKYQPRKQINSSALAELAASIKAQGIIQPLIVRSTEGRYEIIAGERRWRAALLAELKQVPVIIRNIPDNVALAFAIIENIQREELNPLEEAQAFAQLKDEFEMTHNAIAELVGKSRTAVTNALRLLSLAEHVKIWVLQGQLAMGHARALLTLAPEHQLLLAKKIVKNGLTVRQAEQLAQSLKFLPTTKSIEAQRQSANGDYWSAEFSKKFSAPVTVKLNRNGSAKLIIHLDSTQELDKLMQHMAALESN